MSAVVFLDFDGVVTTFASTERAFERAHAQYPGGSLYRDGAMLATYADAAFERERIAHINRIVAETGADVVLVTAWLRFAGVETLTRLLRAAGFEGRVIGETARITLTSNRRRAATREWLAAHPEVTAWVVIDDERGWWRGLAARVVCPDDGITSADADRAIAILRGEVQS